MKTRLAGIVASSTDPTEISNRVKGAVLALSSVIIYAAATFFNFTITPTDVIDLAAGLGVFAGAAWTLWGAGLALIRKLAEIN